MRLYGALGLLVLVVGVACSKVAETPADGPASQQWSLVPSSPTEPPAVGPLTLSESGAAEPASGLPAPVPFVLVTPVAPTNTTLLAELNPRGPKSISQSEFYQIFPRDWIAPIYSPQIARASEVELRTGELVMGVTVNGESRAYPLESLRGREMVNDELGGVPILVTF